MLNVVMLNVVAPNLNLGSQPCLYRVEVIDSESTLAYYTLLITRINEYIEYVVGALYLKIYSAA
jgi:hypothetical protein